MAIIQIIKDGDIQPCHEEHVAQFLPMGWTVYEGKAKAKKASKIEIVDDEVDHESTTPDRCLHTFKDGRQCKNDALIGGEYCHIKSHTG
jgi:hypothetical protein